MLTDHINLPLLSQQKNSRSSEKKDLSSYKYCVNATNNSLTRLEKKINNVIIALIDKYSTKESPYVPIENNTIRSRAECCIRTVTRSAKKLHILGYINRFQGKDRGWTVRKDGKKMPDLKWYYGLVEDKVIYLLERNKSGECRRNVHTRSNIRNISKKEDLILFKGIDYGVIWSMSKITGKSIEKVQEHAYRFEGWCLEKGFIPYDHSQQLLKWIEESEDRGIENILLFRRSVRLRLKYKKEEKWNMKQEEYHAGMKKIIPNGVTLESILYHIANKMTPRELVLFKSRIGMIFYDVDKRKLTLFKKINKFYPGMDFFFDVIKESIPEIKEVYCE